MLTYEEISRIFADKKAIITGDHFVYAQKPDGWHHGDAYVNKDAIYPFVDIVEELCEVLANAFKNYNINVVVGPTVGAVSLAQWTTKWLKKYFWGKYVVAVCADEEDVLEPRVVKLTAPEMALKAKNSLEFDSCGRVKLEFLPGGDFQYSFTSKVGTRRVIKRGYDQYVKDKNCLIVEDVINSGLTVAKTRDAIVEAGGRVIGVGALCNRSGGKVTAESLGVPELFSLLNVNMQMFKEDEEGFCPICREKGRGSVRLDLGKGKDFLNRWCLNPGDK
ncbi:hypothetical protein KKF29_00175 [Patescibacteria group bacterium]|nr:hypothetical protein [Patescibacteria group bacterium]